MAAPPARKLLDDDDGQEEDGETLGGDRSTLAASEGAKLTGAAAPVGGEPRSNDPNGKSTVVAGSAGSGPHVDELDRASVRARVSNFVSCSSCLLTGSPVSGLL